MQNEYFECMCKSDAHMIKFIYLGESEFPGEMPELFLSTFLQTGSLFKRICEAVKYIFGYKSKYGHFSESWFDPENCDRLIGLLERYKEDYSKWQENKEVDMNKD